MDAQDMALMLVIGILVVALIVVNTTPIGQMGESVSVEKPVLKSTAIPIRGTVTTMITIYDPTATTTTSVEVI